jgi:hypothetical protein
MSNAARLISKIWSLLKTCKETERVSIDPELIIMPPFYNIMRLSDNNFAICNL